MKLFRFLFPTVAAMFEPYGFIGAIIGAGASLIGGVMASDDAEDAANAQVQGANIQAQAAREALEFSKQQYGETKENLSPFMNSGKYALSDLEYLLGIGMGRGDYLSAYPEKFGSLSRQFTAADFQESPGYQFNLQQGLDAINKAARRSGKAYAPSTLQDIARFSQGLASNEFNNERNAYRNFQNDMFNRVSGLAGSGQNAAVGLGGFAGQAANSVGNALGGVGNAAINAGNAQAGGIVGGANALTGGISGAYNNWMTNQFLRQAQQPTYTGPGGFFDQSIGDRLPDDP